MTDEIEIPFAHMLISAAFIFLMTTVCSITDQTDLLGVLLGIPLLLGAIAPKRSTYQFLFYYFVMSFLIGQRTIYLTSVIRVTPQEVIIVVLALLLLIFHRRAGVKNGRVRLPFSAKVFTALVVLAIHSAYIHAGQPGTGFLSDDKGRALEIAIYYAKGWLLFLPVFYCTQKLVDGKRELIHLSCVFLTVALILSANSVAERYGLGLLTILGGMRVVHVEAQGASGFARSGTSWGVHMLSASFCLMFVLLYGLRAQFSGRRLANATRAAQLMCLMFIVFAGHRGIWVTLFITLALFYWNQRNKGMLVVLMLCIAGILLIPNSMTARLEGLYGERQDSSSQNRFERVELTKELVATRPYLGHGWGAGGLAHSDLMQIGSDAGLIALGAFLLLYGGILRRLYVFFKNARAPASSTYANALFSGLTGYLCVFLVETHLNIQEVLIIFWLFFALGTVLPRILLEDDLA